MTKTIMTILIAVLISAGAGMLLKNREKSCYIEIQKAFNEFDYKKEMEVKLKKIQESRTHELDSLELDLKITFKEMESGKKNSDKMALFQAKKDNFLKTRERHENDYAKTVSQFDEIIIRQMNEYIKEFGEKNRYRYIFGTDGKGSIMYADSADNATDQVIIFINEKYKGKAK